MTLSIYIQLKLPNTAHTHEALHDLPSFITFQKAVQKTKTKRTHLWAFE